MPDNSEREKELEQAGKIIDDMTVAAILLLKYVEAEEAHEAFQKAVDEGPDALDAYMSAAQTQAFEIVQEGESPVPIVKDWMTRAINALMLAGYKIVLPDSEGVF